jgi:hypothetical protein
MASVKIAYGTPVSMTMTGIEDIDASASLIAGWTSNSVNNTSDLCLDYLVSGQFTLEGSSNQAGTIAVYAYAAYNSTPTWPTTFSSGTAGSVGALALPDTEERDAVMRLVASITCDNSASAVLSFPPTSIAQLFGGVVPPYWALFVTSNATTTTTDWCVSSGTQLYYIPVTATVA